jgi:hypothetical protein
LERAAPAALLFCVVGARAAAVHIDAGRSVERRSMNAPQSFRQWAAGSTVVHVAFGFLSMGAWAVFANRNHPLDQALIAGLVQGAISGSLTLVLKKALERMNAMFFRAPQSDEGVGRPRSSCRPSSPRPAFSRS